MYSLREELLDAVERNIDIELNKGHDQDDEKLDKLYELRDKIVYTPIEEDLEELEIDI